MLGFPVADGAAADAEELAEFFPELAEFDACGAEGFSKCFGVYGW